MIQSDPEEKTSGVVAPLQRRSLTAAALPWQLLVRGDRIPIIASFFRFGAVLAFPRQIISPRC
jgi:hypothetical protein